MRQNPLTDALAALADTSLPRPAFWLLLLGAAAAAILAWRSDPAQRSIYHISHCLLRIIVGTIAPAAVELGREALPTLSR